MRNRNIEVQNDECLVEVCNREASIKEYCNKHYQQVYRYGSIKKRTRYDSNEIVEYESFAELVLYNINSIEVARSLIDLEMVDLVKEHKKI